MIPIQTKDRSVTQNSNVGRSMNYRLDSRNLRHIVTMLRDSVYSNKLLCIIREYSTNSLDAHVLAEEMGRAGMSTTQIEVHLPTKFSPELRIRDFGPGLTTKEIEDVYISLGESTKRTSNKYVGSLGFGCKSAFAYGDRFLVTSWVNGHKTVYNNVLDDNIPEGARCDIMAEAPCSADESGIEICIPIRQNEIEECKKVALDFFKYWEIFPVMTGVTPEEIKESLSYKIKDPIFSGDNWTIYPSRNSYSYSVKGTALMGNVPYTLDWELIQRKLSSDAMLSGNESVIFDFIRSNNAMLTFEIGELEFSVSRETLQYTDHTCSAILDRVRNIINSIQKIIEKLIKNATNIWEAKRIYGLIFGRHLQYEGDSEYNFGGELSRLESYFKNKLMWKGILIGGSSFKNIEKWGVEEGKITTRAGIYYSDELPVEYVLTTFTKNDNRIKKTGGSHKRRRYYQNTQEICPQRQSMVLINDLDKPHGFQVIIRYLLKDKTNNRVFSLKFGNKTIKENFYKEYNFETVPVEYASALLKEAKEWNKNIKGNAPNNTSYWKREDIDIKNLKGTNYFVEVDKDNILVPHKNGPVETKAVHIISSICELDEYSDWFTDIDTIYGLTSKTTNSKWFQSSVKRGEFVNLFELVGEKLKTLDEDEVINAVNYRQYKEEIRGYSTTLFTKPQVESILPNLKFKDGWFYKLCELIGKYDFTSMIQIIKYLNTLGFANQITTDGESKQNPYTILARVVNEKYPLIGIVVDSDYELRNLSRVTDCKQIKNISHYINLIDGESGCKNEVKKS